MSIVVGVDIGTTKVACFIGERGNDPDKVKILGFGTCPSQGLQAGIVQNIDMAARSIRQAVTNAEQDSQTKVDSIYIGIAGHHICGRQNHGEITINDNNTLHIISKEDVAALEATQHNMVLPDGEKIIHIFPMCYKVDGVELKNDISPIGVTGHKLEGTFHIVTGKKGEIAKLLKCVDMAGYHVQGIVLEPIASAYTVLDENDWSSGIAMVDIGGGTTDIAIFYDNSVRYTSVLAAAGDMITEDIRNGCRIMRDQAELLKIKYGSCSPSCVKDNVTITIPCLHGQQPREVNQRTLAEIIQARMKVIVDMIKFEIKNSSGYGDKILNGIVLTGGGSCLHSLKEYVQLTTGMNCFIGTSEVHIESSNDSSEERKKIEEYKKPMYATGIGLVLYGLEQEEVIAENATKQEPEQEPEEDKGFDLNEAILEQERQEEEQQDDSQDHNNAKKKHKWMRELLAKFNTFFNEPIE